jgi:hypothetical protein
MQLLVSGKNHSVYVLAVWIYCCHGLLPDRICGTLGYGNDALKFGRLGATWFANNNRHHDNKRYVG